METAQIITAIISSSVLSAALTSAFNMRIQNLNYKRDYYKMIIERRVEAQEQIIKLSNEMKIMVHLNNGTLCNRICATGEKYFSNFVILVAASVNQSFWLSEELGDILISLNIFLLQEIDYKMANSSESEKNKLLESLGVKNHEKIRELRKQIDKQLLYDFSKMDKVRCFIKSRRKPNDKRYELRKEVN